MSSIWRLTRLKQRRYGEVGGGFFSLLFSFLFYGGHFLLPNVCKGSGPAFEWAGELRGNGAQRALVAGICRARDWTMILQVLRHSLPDVLTPYEHNAPRQCCYLKSVWPSFVGSNHIYLHRHYIMCIYLHLYYILYIYIATTYLLQCTPACESTAAAEDAVRRMLPRRAPAQQRVRPEAYPFTEILLHPSLLLPAL